MSYPIANPGLLQRLAALSCALCLAALLLAAPAKAQVPKYPVILIPGLGEGIQDLIPVRDRLIADGYQVHYFDEFNGVESNFRTALKTANRVKELAPATGKVNLACWSASVMSCRFAMMYLGIQDMVSQVVLYGGGDGNNGMCRLPVFLGGDGCPTHWFAKSLLIGDATPGLAQYFLITSFPQLVTPIPDGGICYKHVPFNGFYHTQEPSQPEYLNFISAAMGGTCLGEFVDKRITNRV